MRFYIVYKIKNKLDTSLEIPVIVHMTNANKQAVVHFLFTLKPIRMARTIMIPNPALKTHPI